MFAATEKAKLVWPTVFDEQFNPANHAQLRVRERPVKRVIKSYSATQVTPSARLNGSPVTSTIAKSSGP